MPPTLIPGAWCEAAAELLEARYQGEEAKACIEILFLLNFGAKNFFG